MQQQETKTDKPLYKVLNGLRTGGIVELRGNKLFFKSGNGFNSLCTIHIQKAWDERANPIEDKEAQANAEFVTLAWNNLASVADALRPLAELDLTGVTGDVVYQRNNSKIYLVDVMNAREALAKIS
jgi:hypothetical protein